MPTMMKAAEYKRRAEAAERRIAELEGKLADMAGALEKARDIMLTVAKDRRRHGPIATAAQSCAYQIRHALSTTGQEAAAVIAAALNADKDSYDCEGGRCYRDGRQLHNAVQAFTKARGRA